MNLRGGPVGSLMKSSFLSSLNPIAYYRKVLSRSILATASETGVLKLDVVKKSLGQFSDIDLNNEGVYSKPIFELDLLHRNWGFLTKGLSDFELKDFEKAREDLESYRELYEVMEYGSDIWKAVTRVEGLIAKTATTNPLNIYRQVRILSS